MPITFDGRTGAQIAGDINAELGASLQLTEDGLTLAGNSLTPSQAAQVRAGAGAAGDADMQAIQWSIDVAPFVFRPATGVVAHESVTATISQTANSNYPSGLTIYPTPITGGNANSESPSFLDSGIFSHFGKYSYLTYVNISGGSTASFPLIKTGGPVSFVFNGRWIYVLTTFESKRFQFLLDDKSVGSYTTAAGSSNVWVVVDFGDVVSGVVTILVDGFVVGGFIGAIAHKTEGSFSACSLGKTAWAISDSYGGYDCSAVTVGSGIVRNALYRLGIRDSFVDAVGGTGYIRQNGSQNGLERLQGIDAYQPDVLLTLLGINDPLPNTYAELRLQILAYYATARTKLPKSIFVSTGSWCPDETKAYNITFNAQLVRQYILEALSLDAGPWVYLDNITGGWIASNGSQMPGSGKSWQTGSGKVGATTGVGNGDFYVSSDGTHPSPAGSNYIEKRLADTLRAAFASYHRAP